MRVQICFFFEREFVIVFPMNKMRFFFIHLCFALMHMAYGSDHSCIPKVVHWFHSGETPFSEEERFCLKSWKKAHEDWVFKIWTSGKDIQTLKREVLEREGGVCVQP